MTDADDRALVRAFVGAGDREAFGVLYDRHTPYLYRLALRLCAANEATAEDVVHDAWVAAATRLAAFEWRSNLRTWLAGFVVNGCRAAGRAAERTSDTVDALAGASDASLSFAPERVDLERGIASLPSAARHVFVLHDVEGWTHRDIGRQLEIEPGTSKSQLSRARALLRLRLDSEERTER